MAINFIRISLTGLEPSTKVYLEYDNELMMNLCGVSRLLFQTQGMSSNTYNAGNVIASLVDSNVRESSIAVDCLSQEFLTAC
jgi:hypothetical protein